jgi:hypothetical protein
MVVTIQNVIFQVMTPCCVVFTNILDHITTSKTVVTGYKTTGNHNPEDHNPDFIFTSKEAWMFVPVIGVVDSSQWTIYVTDIFSTHIIVKNV